jgi:hypothetical protein
VVLIGGLFLTTLQSCNKERVRMEVVKNCHGVFLRDKGGKDFKVCNEEILNSYATGTKVRVTFDNLEECFGLIEVPSCPDEFVFEGKIEVTEIF